MRTKTRARIQVEYIIHIEEIKPWPPSPSLTTLGASLLIHWEHHNSSGFTNPVVPSLGRIEFNQSFKLPVTLLREGDAFQKNCIEFNLYQPRRDKVVLLASAVLDLAAYGVIRENMSLSAPIHCKRTYRDAVQPLVFLRIQPVETSLNRGESVSALMSEEYAQEADVASFTTDDDSSHSSLAERDAINRPSSQNSSMSKASIAKLIHQTDTLFGSGFNLLHHDKNDDPLLDSHLNGLIGNRTNVKHERYVEERSLMEEEGQKIDIDISKNGKSVRSSTEPSKSSGPTRSSQSDTVRGSISSERKDSKAYRKETRSLVPDSRVQHLENRIKILEGELREAAAMEVSLYSVVAEHGSSMNKVHAPARRLSRLYFHANKQNPKSGRRNAAKSVVSGLLLVAKACGNDVPRLTFWLSNAIVLRAITNKSVGNGLSPGSVGCENVKVGDRSGKKLPSKSTRGGDAGDWENPLMFVTALEKIETWIFSRIIESLWWQTFTPHMQSGAILDSECRKSYRRKSSSINQQQGNFSVQLWEKAFRDACERICPVRAGGHECGCLPVLARLTMEQLIARLDVAMFNGILRESADEIPTDPVADPISDAKVLPIPAGKASFGAGAQLKNAIGTWSRWLTDLFGMDDDDMLENEEQTSPKPFHLLNSLSDLMMLPKDMLLSRTIRKEVCPAFGASVIRRILNSFAPDEFCPDPIPAVVIEALNSEDPFDLEDDSIINLPCEAIPIVYQTPSAALVASVLGESSNRSAAAKLKRSGSYSLLSKSQTSDDELDEITSPMKAIMLDRSSGAGWISPNDNAVRYRLLREVWRMDA